MNIIADTHTHTSASTHAYSSLSEVVHAAALKGLYAVAITDHGEAMPGSPQPWYFHNMHVIPRILEGVIVLRGQECNVLDYEGHIDLRQDDEPVMDWIVASMHTPTMPKGPHTLEDITRAWLAVARDPRVHVIGHSGSDQYVFDYERVIPEFGKNGKLVELNESSFINRPSFIPNCARILSLCKKYGVPVILNTDSHFATLVGDFSHSLALLEQMNFPEELVVNSSIWRFNEYLRAHTHVLEEPIFNEFAGGKNGSH